MASRLEGEKSYHLSAPVLKGMERRTRNYRPSQDTVGKGLDGERSSFPNARPSGQRIVSERPLVIGKQLETEGFRRCLGSEGKGAVSFSLKSRALGKGRSQDIAQTRGCDEGKSKTLIIFFQRKLKGGRRGGKEPM